MIGEDVLERGLAAAADDYEVPADGVERLRELIAPRDASAGGDEHGGGVRRLGGLWGPNRHPSRRGWLVMAAAAVAVFVALPFAVGGAGSSGGGVRHEGVTVAGRPATGVGTGTGFGKIPDANRQERLSSKGAQLARVPAPAVAAPELPARTSAGAGGSTTTSNGALDSVAPATTGGGSRAVLPVPAAPERIVKTGELDLEVAAGKVSSTLTRLTALANLERGYVADSRTIEGGDAPSGVVTLRVPVAAFDQTVDRARDLGTKVLSLQTSAHDVTSRYVDLSARISALKKTRSTFLTLLSRASTIGETLAVQQRVSDVQSQIERLQGQRKVLANRSALSTLTVTVNQKAAAVATTHHEKSGFAKAVDRSVSRFVRGVEAIIGVLGPLLLALLVACLLWLAGRLGYRLLRRRLV